MKIHTDPWEHYLYYDSKFIFDFIFNNKYDRKNYNFIRLKFLLYIFHNDLVGNFNGKGSVYANRLIEFIKENEENHMPLLDYIDNAFENHDNPDEMKIENFEVNLETTFGAYIQKLKVNEAFTEHKIDYFDN